MNQSLKNTNTEETEREKKLRTIEEIGLRINMRLKESSKGFETFYSLLSAIVWQSPKELAEEWVQRVAKEEYEELKRPDPDKEINQLKEGMCREALSIISEMIYIFSRNPSRIQQIKSRFLVQNVLAHELPINDQDRIMAKELGMSHETWQSMLGLFSHYPDFLQLLRHPNTRLEEGLNTLGESCYILNTPGGTPEQISSLGSIPGISIEDHVTAEIGINERFDLIMFRMESPALFVSQNTLRRYTDIIGMEKERSAIRTTIYKKFFRGGIPAWKKRFDIGGDNKHEREEQRKLAIEGV